MMKHQEIKEILDQHSLWLQSNGQKGQRASLSGVNLRGAYLEGANLEGTKLEGAKDA